MGIEVQVGGCLSKKLLSTETLLLFTFIIVRRVNVCFFVPQAIWALGKRQCQAAVYNCAILSFPFAYRLPSWSSFVAICADAKIAILLLPC